MQLVYDIVEYIHVCTCECVSMYGVQVVHVCTQEEEEGEKTS